MWKHSTGGQHAVTQSTPGDRRGSPVQCGMSGLQAPPHGKWILAGFLVPWSGDREDGPKGRRVRDGKVAREMRGTLVQIQPAPYNRVRRQGAHQDSLKKGEP